MHSFKFAAAVVVVQGRGCSGACQWAALFRVSQHSHALLSAVRMLTASSATAVDIVVGCVVHPVPARPRVGTRRLARTTTVRLECTQPVEASRSRQVSNHLVREVGHVSASHHTNSASHRHWLNRRCAGARRLLRSGRCSVDVSRLYSFERQQVCAANSAVTNRPRRRKIHQTCAGSEHATAQRRSTE
jgi:hypothetical protein